MWLAPIVIVTSEILCQQVCADMAAKYVHADECGCVCIDSEGEFFVLMSDCEEEKDTSCH